MAEKAKTAQRGQKTGPLTTNMPNMRSAKPGRAVCRVREKGLLLGV